MCTPTHTALALAATLLVASSTAFGWSHATTESGIPLGWDDPVVVYVVDAWADLDGADLVEATCRSARVWSEVPGTAITVDCATGSHLTPGYVPDGPNQNTVTVADAGWTSDSAHLALTVSTFVVETGALLDTDVLVSAPEDVAWSTRGVVPAETYDLHTAILHELGHGLGLGHEHELEDAVMYPTLAPGLSNRRELHEDDCNGMRALYGSGKPPVTETDLGEAPGADAPGADAPGGEDLTSEDSVNNESDGTRSPSGVTSGETLELDGRETFDELDCSAASARSTTPMLLALVGLLLLRVRRAPRRPWPPTLRWLVAISVALVVSAPALVVADTARLLPIEELVGHADQVVTAEVVETSARWDGGLIVTDATLRVDTCVAGSCTEPGATLTVTSLGGEVGDIGQRVSGAVHWTPGERVMVFVADTDTAPRVVAMSQGVFTIEASDAGPVAVRHLHGLVLLHPANGEVLPTTVERYDLVALTRVVAETAGMD